MNFQPAPKYKIKFTTAISVAAANCNRYLIHFRPDINFIAKTILEKNNFFCKLKLKLIFFFVLEKLI